MDSIKGSEVSDSARNSNQGSLEQSGLSCDIAPNAWRISRLFRFSLRSFLLLMVILSVFLVWVVGRANEQKRAVAAIKENGGWVKYDFQFSGGEPDYSKKGNFNASSQSFVPTFLLDRLGYDLFHSVVEINMSFHDGGNVRLENSDKENTDWANSVQGLVNLKSVLVSNNQADDATYEKLGRLKKLKYIYHWDGRQISDKGIEHLANLNSLEGMHLGFSQMTDRSLKVFASLPKLKDMTFQGSVFTDQGLYYLRDKIELEGLWVGRGENSITGDGLKHLYGLKNLTTLGIQEIDATQEDVDELKKHLSTGCKVYYSTKPTTPKFLPKR